MIYPPPPTIQRKQHNIQNKGAERGGWWVSKLTSVLALFTKHWLQLRDPTQRDDACEATGSPLQIHHALLGVLRTVTRPPDYNVV